MHRRTAFQGQFTGLVRSTAVTAAKTRRPENSPIHKPAHMHVRVRPRLTQPLKTAWHHMQELLAKTFAGREHLPAVILLSSTHNRLRTPATGYRKRPVTGLFQDL